MARVEQHSIVPPETFLKSQLVDYIKDDDQESLNSVTEKNVNHHRRYFPTINFDLVFFIILEKDPS